MKKKILSILLVLACLCMCIALTACVEQDETFKVTVKEGTGYTVQGINADGYKEGAEVAFKVVVTDETKQIKSVSANDQALTVNADGNYKLTMPAKDVEISVVLEGKTPPSPSTLKVTVKQGTGFTVQGINADGYKEGAQVAFKVEITDETKQIKEVLANDQALVVKDGYYKFLMPDEAVEISVVLEDKPPILSMSETSVVLNAKNDDSVSVTVTITYNKDSYELEWISGDESVATVTADGTTAEITAVAKGSTTVTVSVKGVENAEAAEIQVTVINVRPWTAAEEAAMQDHLHGIVLYPTEKDEMEAKWESAYGQITISGDWVVDNELADYASQYTVENGWVDVSHLYSESEAYIFEKEVEVAGATRYVRVFIYAMEDETNLSQEGSFYIVAYDPYAYEWPAAYLSEALKEVLSTEVIPSIEAQRYYVANYGVTAYYDSDEEDGGYGAILTEAGYTVEEHEGYYSALSPDEMFILAYYYKDGALQIVISYNVSTAWPATILANAFEYYQAKELEVTAFVLPEFEGDDVSFKFADGTYNKFWVNEGKERNIYGTITVTDSKPSLTNAYKQKLIENGWVKVGDDGMYVKPIAESDQVNKITVTFNIDKSETVITVYYFSIKDPTQGWDDDLIKEKHAFYKYKTDKLPEYTGAITAFSADNNYVYITVPEEDFDTLMDTYKQILVDAGYVLEGASDWTRQYVSPSRQYGIKLSTPSGNPNTLCLYIQGEMPCEWSNDRIKDILQSYGSTLESIPMLESETNFLCKYSLWSSDWSLTLTASDSSEALTQADFDAYKAKLAADANWTQDPDNSNKFVGSDGKTTISLSFSSYSGSITLEIKVKA